MLEPGQELDALETPEAEVAIEGVVERDASMPRPELGDQALDETEDVLLDRPAARALAGE